MSFKHVHAALEAKIPGNLKLVAITFAECADIDSGVCWPSYETVGRRAGISRRQAIRNTKALEAIGILENIGRRKVPGGAVILRRCRIDVLEYLATLAKVVSPLLAAHLVQEDIEAGDNLSLVTPGASGSDTHDTPGVTPMSPEPSMNHQGKVRPSRRCPSDWDFTKVKIQIAKEISGLDVDLIERMVRDHEFAVPKKDWNAVYRNWARNDEKRSSRFRPMDDKQLLAKARELKIPTAGKSTWALSQEVRAMM